eukprot:m.245357 g.245357  ORF g.245357 m.245357 type:complete len:61 (-) comp17468_c0_seq25:7-189(-)
MKKHQPEPAGNKRVWQNKYSYIFSIEHICMVLISSMPSISMASLDPGIVLQHSTTTASKP